MTTTTTTPTTGPSQAAPTSIGRAALSAAAPVQVAIMKDNAMVYFGPFDPAAINEHMPVDSSLQEATVEAKESGVAGDHKVQWQPARRGQGRGAGWGSRLLVPP